MAITIYNSLTRRKEPFEPVALAAPASPSAPPAPGGRPRVGIYLCGPTVYKPSHIGHAVGPIIFDAIKRYLTHRGYAVTWVVNITDVDDKLIVEAKAQGTTVPELAERITRDYLAAMKLLHVDGIDLMPKASEHVGDICAMIRSLTAKDIAYVSGGDVYFDVAKCPGYGKLSNRDPSEQEGGRRALAGGQKRNSGDFALWKAAKSEEPAEVQYDSPWGKGRPGWHIECSAMARRYLGDTFDIHGGGLDLIFPHHENEIAQSECATGRTFAKYWLHNGLTRFNTKKVSKSDTDPEAVAALRRMTLHNLLKEFTPEHIRFFILSTHYRRPIEFSDEELEGKRKGLSGFYRTFERVERICGRSPYGAAGLVDSGWHDEQEGGRSPSSAGRGAGEGAQGLSAAGSLSARAAAGVLEPELMRACLTARTAFEEAMDDDFNTAGAIAALFEFAPVINRAIDQWGLEAAVAGGQAAHSTRANGVLAAAGHLIALGRLIGLFLEPPPKEAGPSDEIIGRVMQVLIEVRQHLRKKKDFETADLIRKRLTDAGITLEDGPGGTIWRRE